MPLKRIDLHIPLLPIQWLVPGLIPKGYLSLVGSLPGEGKTALLTALAWQLSRPLGDFVGYDLQPCPSIYLDFDAPAEGRGLRYWLERHARAYPDGRLEMIHVLEPDPNTYGLGEAELQELHEEVRQSGAGVVMEEFRSILADSVVLSLLNNKRLTLEDFDDSEGYPRLRKDSFPKFLRAWEERLCDRVRHPMLGKTYSYRQTFLVQARILTKHLMGELPAYEPFTVR